MNLDINQLKETTVRILVPDWIHQIPPLPDNFNYDLHAYHSPVCYFQKYMLQCQFHIYECFFI